MDGTNAVQIRVPVPLVFLGYDETPGGPNRS